MAGIAVLFPWTIVVLAGQPPVPSNQPRIFLEARAAAKSNDWGRAAQAYHAFVATNPNLGDAWSELANAEYQIKNYDEAIAAYRRIVGLGFYPKSGLYNIAGCLALQGKKEAAYTELEEALRAGFDETPSIGVDSDFAILHGEERFQRLAGQKLSRDLTRVEQWQYDLDWLAHESVRLHYRPFGKQTEASFNANVAALRRDLSALSDAQIVVRLFQMMAKFGDGHTQLDIPVIGRDGLQPDSETERARIQFHALPIRFFKFSDGMRATACAETAKAILGQKLVSVGGIPIVEALARISGTISFDNSMWLETRQANRLHEAETLYCLGLSAKPEECVFAFEDESGQQSEVRLNVKDSIGKPLVLVRDTDPEKVPLFLKHPDLAYWSECLPEARTMYVKYHRVLNIPSEPLVKFWPRVFAEAKAKNADRFVIDLRSNTGGNSFLNQSLLKEILRSPEMNRKGHLFVIIGRWTFSAGMNAAVDLERDTEAIFVGEPTGSPPNFIGENSPVLLPYSGLRAGVSTLYHQHSFPQDQRIWIAPLILAEPTIEDWKANRDPAMEAVLGYGEP